MTKRNNGNVNERGQMNKGKQFSAFFHTRANLRENGKRL